MIPKGIQRHIYGQALEGFCCSRELWELSDLILRFIH